ncbi:hypothetical protein [Thermococcus sp.]|uniref:hypothetical protein n=1 Tax=Thermococcus sp. TaxID=35749 RepID=UPI0025D9E812|nr:hypothetical protein [Thermococcus sp.]
MTDERKALLKEAYQFGYFVGFRGHSEWAEWVRQKREELYQRAEELGIYELVKDAYRKGKELGKREKEEKLYEGLVARVEKEEEPRVRKISPHRVEAKLPEETPSKIERDYVEFLQSTKLTMPPELLDSLKHLEPPKMLRLGE